MNDIAGIPYAAAHFDKDGAALDKQKVTLPDGTTDVVVAAHGWNNTEEQAEQLYTELFTSFAAVAPDQLQNKKIAIVGVIWPSKKFTDVVDAAVAEQGPGGGAGFGGSSTAADETIKAKLDLIATMFDKKRRKRSALQRTRLANWRVILMHAENLSTSCGAYSMTALPTRKTTLRSSSSSMDR
jgi:hypothetical protein